MSINVNKAPYVEGETDSISNLGLFIPGKVYYDIIKDVDPDVVSKTIFKKVFGRQQICKNYSYRNWVWTFSDEHATIYCMVSTRGASFEYNYVKSKDGEAIQNLFNKIMERIKALLPSI